MPRNGVRLVLCLTAVSFAAGPVAAQSDTGRLVEAPQKTQDELIQLLQSLQLAPRTPEERQRFIDMFRNMSPEQKQHIQELAAKYSQGAGPAGSGLATPPVQPGGRVMPSAGGQPGQSTRMGERLPEPDRPGTPAGIGQPPAPLPGGGQPVPSGPGPGPMSATRSPAGATGGNGPARGSLEERLRERPDVQRMIGLWEKNVAPLEKTPALKKAILDFIRTAEQKGASGEGGGDGLLSLMEQPGEAGEAGNWSWIDKAFEGSSLNLSDLGLKDWAPNLSGLGDWNAPSAPAASFPGGFGGSSWDGSFSPLLLLILLGAAALIAWRYWPNLVQQSTERTDLSRQLWPVDPRSVADREGLVKAFEYLSVHLCGDAARVWNHRTIAAALRARIVGADVVSDELAVLYELARYTPPAEELPPGAIAAARRGLCHLAGVSPA